MATVQQAAGVALGCVVAERILAPRVLARRTRWLLTGVAFVAHAAVLAGTAGPAFAQTLPSGGTVTAGSAAITQPSAGAMLVIQTTPNAIINWSSFSIGQGGSVRFENGAGATLNRVTGFTRSQIDGSLSASGSLYLVNPNGITVGPTGIVTTGGRFIASTHDVSDADFLAGRDMTFRGSSTASVINYGQIGSLGGDVALIARKVENTGTITAPDGTVALAAGYEVLVRDTALSNGKFVVKVGGADTEVKTSGVIKAAEAELRASGGNVYALAGNTESLTKATGVATKGGRVFLTAGEGGTVTVSQKVVARGAESGGKSSGGEIRVSAGKVSVSGKLDAAGTADAAGAWAKGGTIIVTGRDIALAGGADLDASGASGGIVLVGGDYQGGASAVSKTVSEAVDTAQTVSVATGASLRADGREGAGGKVVVWSDSTTRFAGAISATGTTAGGDAEVSGKGVLDYAGTADLRGTGGRFGTLLLDPYNLTISTGTDSNVSGFTATGDNSVLNVTTLTNALATANVTVSTGSGGAQAGDITVAAPISWSANSVLTLAAAGNVIVNSAITATGTNAGLVIQYGAGKDYSVAAPITLSGTSATLQIGATGALSSYTLLRSMAAIDAIETTGLAGKYALAADLDAAGTTYTSAVVTGAFTGSFAGLGHTISNLTINAPGTDYVGLFQIASLSAGNSVRDLTLAGGSITGKTNVGTVIGGMNSGTVLNVHASADVTGTSLIGGLIGLTFGGAVIGSSAAGNVVGTAAGGFVGGLIGEALSTITSSFATGNVSGAGDNVGGLAGDSWGAITGSYATGAVTNSGNFTGGLVGRVNGSSSISNSYATGAVSGVAYVGGLTGFSQGSTTNSYATGSATGTSNVGGLVGLATANVTQSYASGAVSGTGSNIGGLIGSRSGGTVSQSYWDTDSSGQTVGIGNEPSNAGAVGLTSAQARQSSNYAGWNFSTDWYQTGDTRPIGRWEAAPVVGGVATIVNAHQLQLMNLNLAGAYVLGADIGLSATASTLTSSSIWGASGFQSIGFGSNFTGSLDGQNHTLSGLTINAPTSEYVGLISVATLAGGSGVHDLTLAGGSITAKKNAGAVIGALSSGNVQNVHASVDVTGERAVGGLVGNAFGGSITGSSAGGDVVATSGGSAGGLVGSSNASIASSSATGNVSATGNYAGGLAGLQNGTLTGSYATGSVTNTGNGTGGLVGSGSATITNSYATGAVTSTGEQTGGLVGSITGTSFTVSNSYATGAVTGTAYTGGLAGQAGAGAGISQSYATGAVTGTDYVGGLSGTVTAVSQSYASGAVSGTGTKIGGLIGQSYGTVSQSYWDKDSTGQAVGIGSDPANTGATGLTSAQARQSSSYVGWDFANTWYQTGDLRPIGRWEAAPVVNGVATITNAHQLQLVKLNLAGTYVLGADIDLSATASTATSSGIWGASGFQPIGNNSTPFTGSLDGQGHTISALTIVRSGDNYSGLFGYADTGAILHNLILDGGSVTGSLFYSGGLVGYNKGAITSVTSSVSVAAAGYSGGVAGTNTGTISQSSASGTVTGWNSGGLVGENQGAISSSYASGSVGSTTDNIVGGLVGSNVGGTLTDVHATGAVQGNSPLGGLVGEVSGASVITNAYATGAVTGGWTQSGGLVGDMTGGTITNAYATGSVTVVSNASQGKAGGLIGTLSGGTLSNVYATGDVSVTMPSSGTSAAGGLIGEMYSSSVTDGYATGSVTADNNDAANAGGLVGSSISGTLTRVYASGAVTATGGTTEAGGLVGSGTATFTNAYWDTDSTTQSGALNGASATGATGLTSTQARQSASYVGWDFTTTWYQTGDMRPIGRWEAAPVVNGVATVTNAHQLQLVKLNLAGTYVLGADIDLSATASTATSSSVWGAIGFQWLGDNTTPFTGSLDGQGHTISALTIKRSGGNYTGLFGYADTGAILQNLILDGGSVSGGALYSGGLVGYNKGTITSVTSGVAVSGGDYVGGVVGYNTGTVSHSSASGRVLGWESGGLAGYNSGTISSSHASGNVGDSTRNTVGGLVGENAGGTLIDVYATGTATGYSPIGGLVGTATGASVITNAYATGAVKGTWTEAGGLVGSMSGSGKITNAYATGSVTLNSITGTAAAGGLVGSATGATLTNVYATGAVVATTATSGASRAGGLIGSATSSSITDGYATSSVTATNAGISNAGGVVGYSNAGTLTRVYASGVVTATGATTAKGGLVGSGTATFTKAYWDTDSTTQSGALNGASASGATGLTSTQARNYTNYDWDFTTTWYQTGDMRPIGRWEAAPVVNGVATIMNGHQLQLVNTNLSGTYVLGADIDLAATNSTLTSSSVWGGKGFQSIAYNGYTFTGSLDGQGHTIANLTINAPDDPIVGLFAQVGDGATSATVKNLTLSGGSISGLGTVGALAGSLTRGTISNVHSNIDVNASASYVGGLFGYVEAGSITGSSSSGDVTTGGESVGGLAGYTTSATITSSSATGAVQGSNYVGGLVGFALGAVSQSYATGAVTGTGYMVGGLAGRSAAITGSWASGAVSGNEYVGGLAGSAGAAIKSSYATGTVTATASTAGGLAGDTSSAVTSSYASGAVNAATMAGGLIGESYGAVTFSYATGAVTATGDQAGGLVGHNEGTISQSFASGTVSGGTSVGGLVGYNTSAGSISQSFGSGNVSGAEASGGLAGLNVGTITQSYATGSVTVTTGSIGGFVGSNAGTISESYSTGLVTGGVEQGGFVGANGGTISSSYWDTQTSGQASSAGGTGLTTAQMHDWSSYQGWDWHVWAPATVTSLPLLYGVSGVVGVAQTGTYGNDPATAVVSYLGKNAWNTISGTPTTTLSTSTNAGVSYTLVSGMTGTYAAGGATTFVGVANIAQRAITVTADGQSRAYGNANPTSGAVSVGGDGLVNGDTISSASTSSTATTASNVGTYNLLASDAVFSSGAASNYAITYTDNASGLNVTQRAITVTADGQSRTYGNANPTSGAVSVGGDGLVNGDAISSASTSSTATTASNVGTYNLLASDAVFSSGAASNYAITYANNASGLNVTQRAITVTADGQSRAYGNANPTSGAVSVGGDGLVNGDTISSASTSSTATTASNVGTYNLLASDAVFSSGAASNYAITYTDNASGLNVTQRAITVTADGQSRTYGNANPTSGAVSVGGDGLVNGDTISSASTSSTATTASNVGTYNLLASNAVFSSGAASNYAITYTDNASGLNVTQRAITVTADGQSRAYGNANPTSGAVSVGGDGLVNGDTISSASTSSTATTASNVGTYNLLASDAVFSSGAASNYAITYTDNASGLNVTQRAITVTADGQSRTYGNANPTSGAVSVGGDGLVNGDTISSASTSSTATTASNVGTYNLLASDAVFSSGAASNYAITYANNASGLNVTQRAITVTADNQVRPVGQSNPPLTYQVGGAGLVNGDTLSGALETPATTASPPGTYPITQGTLAASANYSLTYVEGVLAVTGVSPLAILVASIADEPTYVQTAPEDIPWLISDFKAAERARQVSALQRGTLTYGLWLSMSGN